MRYGLKPTLIILLISFGGITSCSQSASLKSSSPEVLDITVSVVPQEYFVKKIGGDRVKINVMVPPGTEPDNYEPKPQQIQALSQADAYIKIGIPFENTWISKIAKEQPKMLMIDSTKGIKRLPMIPHEHHQHEGENQQEDTINSDENTLDPHIWLSPKLVKIQAKTIYDGLVKLDPKNQPEYQANLNKFLQEIEQLDTQIKQNLANIKQRKFIVFHPAWGYFAQQYNLTQIPVEVGGQEPSAAELSQLIKEAKEEQIKVVFAQPELSSQAAKTIAKEINGEVLLISPIAGDWYNNLLKVSQTFSDALKKQ
ncbi:metal ABC transporter solute-binding protein, Zn/Mn family [Aphanothece sacrum]|uniref:Cation ABC transporter substrate-binding protein n=1 Tax=Aphanothece sacrum FPU1 TaxID=1920663 RepID=A0A401IK04_APHSA|nr:zinc ABC transporter substrate-binding protein [Aphanothece sacrum]GBF81589.1 cation ABC transporter substrate-binding protein [Aphanothece sacrum FPU1]GBF84153.1 cation ABC transporter substrate-binding protein [Aphanothece sacrum FPU3]